MKVNDVNLAITETALYAHCSITESKDCPLTLGFPVTRYFASPYIFVLAEGRVWILQVADGNPDNSALLCTLYAAVH